MRENQLRLLRRPNMNVHGARIIQSYRYQNQKQLAPLKKHNPEPTQKKKQRNTYEVSRVRPAFRTNYNPFELA